MYCNSQSFFLNNLVQLYYLYYFFLKFNNDILNYFYSNKEDQLNKEY